MSIFKKGLANIFGIDGTKIDTVLVNNNVSPGDIVNCKVNIYGGEVSQYIDKVILKLNTTYKKEIDDSNINVEKTIQEFYIKIDKTINPNENISIPFSFKLDYNCPISKGNSRTVLKTRLDIENAVDSSDGDALNVVPSKYMQNIFDSIKDIGFRIREIETIESSYKLSKKGFVQEFEYDPTNTFRGKLDELEVIFNNDENGIKLYLQIDRKAKCFMSLISEALSLDESFVSIYFNNSELEDSNYIKDKLYNLIINHS